MPTKIEASPPGKLATSEEFFEALHAGDTKAAADLLRRMGTRGPSDVELLADLLSGDPVHAKLFPFVLTLARRRQGRPSKDPLKRMADQARVAREVDLAHKKLGRVKPAVAAVGERTKWGRSKIYKARKVFKKNVRS